MRISSGVLLGGMLALATSGLAYAQTSPEGPYIGLEGGGNFLGDISPHGGGADTRSTWDGGYVGLGSLGYNFGNGFRAELEGGYRRNDVDGVRNSSPGSATGALGVYTAIVNGLYDFDLAPYGINTYGFVPHLGVGVGWAQPRFDHAGTFFGNTVSGKDDLFAYQGIAGVDYAVMPNVKVSLDYKYLGTTDGDFHVSPLNTSTRTSITDQAVLLGVRYEFATPPPPPAPFTPTPVVHQAPPPVAQPEAQRQFQVFFDFDKSDLTGAARQVIQAAANSAKQGNFVHLVVTGHTDTVGSAKYNQGLSERRALSVKRELVSDGLPDGEIETKGVGKTDLLVPTADGVREPQNRRATIELGPNAQS